MKTSGNFTGKEIESLSAIDGVKLEIDLRLDALDTGLLAVTGDYELVRTWAKGQRGVIVEQEGHMYPARHESGPQ